MDNQFNNQIEVQEKEIKDIIFEYIYYWKWFLFTIIISLIGAFIYLKLKTPSFDVHAKVLLKDEDSKGGLTSELSAFSDLSGLMGSGGNIIENEIEIYKSRSLISEVVENLQLNVKYYDISSKFVKKELYKNSSYKIEFLTKKPIKFNTTCNFNIRPISKDKFEFENLKSKQKEIQKFGIAFTTKFGQIIIFPNGELKPMEIVFEDFNFTVDNLQEKLKVEAISKEASVIALSLKLENIKKGKDIINKLIEIHSQNGVDDKNQISKNTLGFINERLNVITKELSYSENNVSDFKSSNKIFDLNTNANLFFESQSDNEKLLIKNSTQIKLAEYIINCVEKFEIGTLLPANLGIQNISIENKIESFNSIQLERNRLLLTSSVKNPIILNIDNQLNQIRNSLMESLQNQLNILKIENKEIEKQNNFLNSRLQKAPKQEKDFKEIFRQQQIKEGLYIYLLQKREETSISLAVTVSKTKTIEDAYSNNIPSSTSKKIIYILALLLGIMIPVIWIYIYKMFDTKIYSKKDFDDYNLPIIGDIPLGNNEERLIVKPNDRSPITEAFRLLRTNINFLTIDKTEKGKIILISSTISKEGKSFISLNLASVYGLSGKKTLLIGLDLRVPKLLEYLQISDNKGVTDYIVNPDIEWRNLIHKLPETKNVDLLPSGTIPPNPAELLMSDRINHLFDELKKEYDYIIVDTAPIGLVADTLLLNKFSDVLIYVSRLNYLDKRMLNIPQALFKEKKFKNMMILTNGSVNKIGNGYGYGYGNTYGYGAETIKKKWYDKILNILRLKKRKF